MIVQTRPYHWYCLFGAIILEVGGTTVMKLAQGWGFAHAELLGLLLMWGAIALSYYLLALCTTGLPVGVAFAFWEGLGLTLITLSSVFVLGEDLSLKRLLGLGCVLSGALLIHFGTTHGEDKAPPSRPGPVLEPQAGQAPQSAQIPQSGKASEHDTAGPSPSAPQDRPEQPAASAAQSTTGRSA